MKLYQIGIIPAQNPYNFLIKEVPVKKTAIIGIGIAIIVAGIVGIYAVSITQEGPSAEEVGIGIGEEVDVTIEEEELKEAPTEESKIDVKDEAVATVEEPEEEPPDEVEIKVKEGLGMGDPQK